MVKNLPAMQETWVPFLDLKDPLEEGMATHSSILTQRIHGQRSLAGYRPWGRKCHTFWPENINYEQFYLSQPRVYLKSITISSLVSSHSLSSPFLRLPKAS